jgi:hypothetical protein
VAELDEHVRFLPDDLGLGEPGLETRCLAALGEAAAEVMPDLGTDWGPRLARAGFEAVTRQDFEITLDQPLPPDAGRYAQRWLERTRSRLADTLSAGDLAVLDVITASEGPQSVLHRRDLAIRAARFLWSGRRP